MLISAAERSKKTGVYIGSLSVVAHMWHLIKPLCGFILWQGIFINYFYIKELKIKEQQRGNLDGDEPAVKMANQSKGGKSLQTHKYMHVIQCT